MKIGVISDTHDRLDSLKKAITIFKKEKIEMLIHCGDWVSPFTLEFFYEQMKDFPIPVKSVIGNNPGDLKRVITTNSKTRNPIEFAKTVTLELLINKKKMIIYHGDDPALLKGLIDSQQYDVIFTGHTHAIRKETAGKTLVFNPGSTSYACEGKIIKKASVGIYDTLTNKCRHIFLPD